MNKYIKLGIGLFIFASCTKQNHVLYKNDAFTLYNDSITQGPYKAIAISDSEIISNWLPDTSFRQTIVFKFGINNRDCEQKVSSVHTLKFNPFADEVETPIIDFGQALSIISKGTGTSHKNPFTKVTFRLNMRPVYKALKEKGEYICANGDRYTSVAQIKNIVIAGWGNPLTWTWDTKDAVLYLKDDDHDTIFETTINMPTEIKQMLASGHKTWKKKVDTKGFPSFLSPHRIVNAAYNLSLEEMLLDIRTDSTFMAGELWTGVWTRDISHSINLSLAILAPDIAKRSLMKKVKNKRIIQDTGTGGSWPVSTDRTTWSVAAYEIYKVTGDTNWLYQAFEIIKNTVEADMLVIRDTSGLYRGESAFMDWREQSYPRWMGWCDIGQSLCLCTNIVHYQTLIVLQHMAKELGQPFEKYATSANNIKNLINEQMWMPEKGYYCTYLYGRNYYVANPRSSGLGGALAVIYGIANPNQAKLVIAQTPVTLSGTPCFSPQLPNIPSYHNNAVWPFVEAYWAWASAEAGNEVALSHSISSIYRQSAFFLTNKENLTASHGQKDGTECNSNRQLWSVAGNLSIVYRIFYGMRFYPDKVEFRPFVPKNFAGKMKLEKFNYRKSILDISISGYGNKIQSFKIDGKAHPDATVAGNTQGRHAVEIVLSNNTTDPETINLAGYVESPETPVTEFTGKSVHWKKTQNAKGYQIYRNGKKVAETSKTSWEVMSFEGYAEYQVLAVDEKGNQSFLSEPLAVENNKVPVIVIQAERFGTSKSEHQGFEGKGYLPLDLKTNTSVKLPVNIANEGLYEITFRYANGNGDGLGGNTCAVRSLAVNGNRQGSFFFPQLGDWSKWGTSSRLQVHLKKGLNNLELFFEPNDTNMNGEINDANIDYCSIRCLY